MHEVLLRFFLPFFLPLTTTLSISNVLAGAGKKRNETRRPLLVPATELSNGIHVHCHFVDRALSLGVKLRAGTREGRHVVSIETTESAAFFIGRKRADSRR